MSCWSVLDVGADSQWMSVRLDWNDNCNNSSHGGSSDTFTLTNIIETWLTDCRQDLVSLLNWNKTARDNATLLWRQR